MKKYLLYQCVPKVRYLCCTTLSDTFPNPAHPTFIFQGTSEVRLLTMKAQVVHVRHRFYTARLIDCPKRGIRHTPSSVSGIPRHSKARCPPTRLHSTSTAKRMTFRTSKRKRFSLCFRFLEDRHCGLRLELREYGLCSYHRPSRFCYPGLEERTKVTQGVSVFESSRSRPEKLTGSCSKPSLCSRGSEKCYL